MLDEIIKQCQTHENLSSQSLHDLDEEIVKVLGWEDQYRFTDKDQLYPSVSFTGKEKPLPPKFTTSLYEVRPYLTGRFGWEIKVPCPNPLLTALVGPLDIACVRIFNLNGPEKIDIVASATTEELAFCAAWLMTVRESRKSKEMSHAGN